MTRVKQHSSGYPTLAATIARAARGKRVVGFDVFDTLLRRRIEPETVKDLVAKRLARLIAGVPSAVPLATWGVPDWSLLREKRRRLEHDMGVEAQARGDDHEFRLRDMTRRWVTLTLPEPHRSDAALVDRFVAELVSHEIACEQAATFRAPAIGEVLAAAKAENRRLIFVSDSYKSIDDIRALLNAKGLLEHFPAGYVSSEAMRTKRSARLFEHVLAKESLAPADLLFVGDNPYADVDSSAKHGIDSVHIRDTHEARRRTRLKMLDESSRRNTFFVGDLHREIIETAPAHINTSGSCEHYELGRLLAPGFIAFTLHILEQAFEKKLRQVFFLSREGYTFQKMYRRLVRAMNLDGVAPSGEYVVASRASTFLASFEKFDQAEIERIWRQYSRQSIVQLLRNLSLPLDTFMPLARRCGFENFVAPILDLHGDPALKRFIADAEVQREFFKCRDEARGLLADYLRGKGWFAAPDQDPGRVGLVDIGWKGSIQNNIFRAMNSTPSRPGIEGLYFAITRSGHDDHPDNAKHGYMADTRTGDWIQECIFKNGPVFEMFSTAMHSSPEGYRALPRAAGEQGPRRVKPVLKREATEEKNFSTSFASVRRGIEDTLEETIRVLPLLDFSSAELRPFMLDQLRRYILYPTRREARAFLEYSHVENFGVFKVSDYHFKGSWRKILTGGGPLDMPRRMIEELRHQLWPEAICRRSGVPMANLAFDMVETRRAKKFVP
jgi:FMN phosphatase YigB (HAD superfamily)